ncbi:MAG: hypothetical protein K6A69_04690 [Lachnospiraceae bacterium]|nr:hypothetical protein [Lachnospiraceae bacterium]
MAESYLGGAYSEVYAHESWEETAEKYEQVFGTKLYDVEAARMAGHDALSKVSKLIVRYNRLQDMKQSEAMATVGDTMIAEQSRVKSLKYIDQKREELEKLEAAGTLSAPDSEKKKKELDEAVEKANRRYEEEVAKINRRSAIDRTAFAKTQLDRDDDGAILATTMLGGRGMSAGLGYTLSRNGDDMDVRRGGAYVRDVIKGANGTSFLDQMAILDNAVNNGVINLKGNGDVKVDPTKGRSQEGATESLREIIENLTEADLRLMNTGDEAEIIDFSGEYHGKPDDIEFDFATRDKLKNDKTLDDMLGAKQGPMNVAFVENGRLATGESIGRANGVYDEKSTFGENPKGIHKKKMKPGFFGKIWSGLRATKTPEDEERNFASKTVRRMGRTLVAGRSRASRAEMEDARYQAWLSRAKQKRQLEESKEYHPDMEKDTGAKAAEKSDRFKLPSRAETVKKDDNGFTKKMDKTLVAEGEGENQVIKEAFRESSRPAAAKHMMNVYKLLGAKDGDLLNFRMALLSYNLITKQRTMYDVMKQSEDAGVKGTEDMTEPATMYTTVNPPGKAGVKSLLAGYEFPHETVFAKMVQEMQEAQVAAGADITGPKAEGRKGQMLAGRLLAKDMGLQKFAALQMTGRDGNIRNIVTLDNFRQYSHLIEPTLFAEMKPMGDERDDLIKIIHMYDLEDSLNKLTEQEGKRLEAIAVIRATEKELKFTEKPEKIEELQTELALKKSYIESLPPKPKCRKQIRDLTEEIEGIRGEVPGPINERSAVQDRLNEVTKSLTEKIPLINAYIDIQREGQLKVGYGGSTPDTQKDPAMQKRVQIITRLATRLVADDLGTDNVKDTIKRLTGELDYQAKDKEQQHGGQANPIQGHFNPANVPLQQQQPQQPPQQPQQPLMQKYVDLKDTVPEFDEDLEDDTKPTKPVANPMSVKKTSLADQPKPKPVDIQDAILEADDELEDDTESEKKKATMKPKVVGDKKIIADHLKPTQSLKMPFPEVDIAHNAIPEADDEIEDDEDEIQGVPKKTTEANPISFGQKPVVEGPQQKPLDIIDEDPEVLEEDNVDPSKITEANPMGLGKKKKKQKLDLSLDDLGVIKEDSMLHENEDDPIIEHKLEEFLDDEEEDEDEDDVKPKIIQEPPVIQQKPIIEPEPPKDKELKKPLPPVPPKKDQDDEEQLDQEDQPKIIPQQPPIIEPKPPVIEPKPPIIQQEKPKLEPIVTAPEIIPFKPIQPMQPVSTSPGKKNLTVSPMIQPIPELIVQDISQPPKKKVDEPELQTDKKEKKPVSPMAPIQQPKQPEKKPEAPKKEEEKKEAYTGQEEEDAIINAWLTRIKFYGKNCKKDTVDPALVDKMTGDFKFFYGMLNRKFISTEGEAGIALMAKEALVMQESIKRLKESLTAYRDGITDKNAPGAKTQIAWADVCLGALNKYVSVPDRATMLFSVLQVLKRLTAGNYRWACVFTKYAAINGAALMMEKERGRKKKPVIKKVQSTAPKAPGVKPVVKGVNQGTKKTTDTFRQAQGSLKIPQQGKLPVGIQQQQKPLVTQQQEIPPEEPVIIRKIEKEPGPIRGFFKKLFAGSSQPKVNEEKKIEKKPITKEEKKPDKKPVTKEEKKKVIIDEEPKDEEEKKIIEEEQEEEVIVPVRTRGRDVMRYWDTLRTRLVSLSEKQGMVLSFAAGDISNSIRSSMSVLDMDYYAYNRTMVEELQKSASKTLKGICDGLIENCDHFLSVNKKSTDKDAKARTTLVNTIKAEFIDVGKNFDARSKTFYKNLPAITAEGIKHLKWADVFSELADEEKKAPVPKPGQKKEKEDKKEIIVTDEELDDLMNDGQILTEDEIEDQLNYMDEKDRDDEDDDMTEDEKKEMEAFLNDDDAPLQLTDKDMQDLEDEAEKELQKEKDELRERVRKRRAQKKGKK